MDLLRELLTLLYILGLAGVFGGFLHQAQEKNKNVNYAMFVGGMAQAVAYLLLLVWSLTDGGSFDTRSIVLLIITLVIGALTFVFRNKTGNNLGVWLVVGLLSVLAFAMQFVWPTLFA